MKKFTADTSERLDLFLVRSLKISRAKVGGLVKNGGVFVDGNVVKAGFLLKGGEEIKVKEFDFSEQEVLAEEFGFEILYEDSACFVLNKPAGVVVHSGNDGKHFSGTVANALLSKIEAGEFAGSARPGIVHRLDKDTSGALLVAKTRQAYENLVAQFKERTVFKSYTALVFGRMEHPTGLIDSPIGRSPSDRKKMAILVDGKEAKSKYLVLKEFGVPEVGGFVSLLQVQIMTGRTHQIRVHLAAIGHPVVGDCVYGSSNLNGKFAARFGLKRQFLHAGDLRFVSPESGEEITIKAPLEGALEEIARELGS